MIFVINKETMKIYGTFDTIYLAKSAVSDESKFYFTEECGMNYISRITYIDDVCVYNNKDFWCNKAYNILDNFSEHKIIDILGHDINEYRFKTELVSNINRITEIDGRPGQIEYNMEVGNEFISLFREECILTEFNNRSNTSPMIIFQKLEPAIGMVQIGAFREAKQFLEYYREKIKDDFLTDERIDKYIAMLDAADSIEYATSEDEFVYHAPEETDDTAEEE